MNEAPAEAGKDFWKICNICKKSISFNSVYYLCSVGACRAKRTGLTFCSVPCYDGHLGFMRHRDSYCEEETAPAKAA